MDRHGFAPTTLRSLEARRVTYEWDWARAQSEAIAGNWARRRAQRPALFDGPVLLCCDCTIENGHCTVSFFETRYACFLAFRDAGSPDGRVANAFAAIVPHSADGAVLLGEMAPHTANAGQVYFPCGTPDRDDVRADGSVDLGFSAARELAEETGLAPPPGADEAPWLLLRGESQCAFLRPVAFDGTADVLAAAIDQHRRGQTRPELSRIVRVSAASGIDAARMPGFVRAYLDRHFSG